MSTHIEQQILSAVNTIRTWVILLGLLAFLACGLSGCAAILYWLNT